MPGDSRLRDTPCAPNGRAKLSPTPERSGAVGDNYPDTWGYSHSMGLRTKIRERGLGRPGRFMRTILCSGVGECLERGYKERRGVQEATWGEGDLELLIW